MQTSLDNFIQRGSLEIDVPRYVVSIYSHGQKVPVELTPIECKILCRLAQSPGYIFTREQLIESVWGDGISIEARSVDKHISSLRKKLGSEPRFIRTVSGLGYQFIEQNQSTMATKPQQDQPKSMVVMNDSTQEMKNTDSPVLEISLVK